MTTRDSVGPGPLPNRGALVTVVLLNWNSGELGARAARSVTAQDWPEIELVVVDNASTDDSLAAILRTCPPDRVVRHERNLYFARGMNAGVAQATGAYVLPLNCDAEIDTNYVRTMVEVLDRRPRAAAAGGLVRSPRVADAGPLAITRLMRTTGLDTKHPTRCDKLNGACPVFREVALRQVIDRFGGPYESSYGMYGEDIELAYTLARLGWEFWYEPSAGATHVRSYGSAPRLKDREGYLRSTTLANRHRNIVRHGSRWSALDMVIAAGQDAGFGVWRWATGDRQAPADVLAAWKLVARHFSSDLQKRRSMPPRWWQQRVAGQPVRPWGRT